MAEIISKIAMQGGKIKNVRICRSSLEDVFMKLTGKSIHNNYQKIDKRNLNV